MRRMTMGIFGLAILLGNQLGSILGIAIAICVFMILDGIIEMIAQSTRKNKPKKELVNYVRTSNRNSNNFTGHQRGVSEGLKQKDESTKE